VTACVSLYMQALSYGSQLLSNYQGCGLGLDISVLRQSQEYQRLRRLISQSRPFMIYVLCPRPIFGQIVQTT